MFLDKDFQQGSVWKDIFDNTPITIVEVKQKGTDYEIHYNRAGMKETQKLPKNLFLKRYARYC